MNPVLGGEVTAGSRSGPEPGREGAGDTAAELAHALKPEPEHE
jgi:hypothetical protein